MREIMTTFWSPQLDPVVLTVAVILLMIGLLLSGRRLVAWGLGVLAPAWIPTATVVLESLVLLGGVALLVVFLEMTVVAALLALLLCVFVAVAMHSDNLISDGVATLRIRAFGPYRAGDWVTVADGVSAHVVAIQPFSTLLKTLTGAHVVVSNSRIMRAPILVHPSQPAAPAAVATPKSVAQMAATAALPAVSEVGPSEVAVAADVPVNAPPVDAPMAILAPTTPAATVVVDQRVPAAERPRPARKAAPLFRRPTLGKKSIGAFL